MTDEQFAALIELGVEQRNVEYKGAGTISDKHLVHKVVRAILGMANRLNGGYVVVGVEEVEGGLNPVGVDAKTNVGWTRDSLADKVAPLVDPSVDFDLERRSYQDRQFVVITVREFDETPVFCRANRHDAGGKIVLREGALYVRSRRKPETVEIGTAQDMRDLLDLALRKRLRHFMQLLQAAGLSATVLAQASDREKFEAQVADLEF